MLMCKEAQHICYCGKTYPCTYPNWVCPTNNGDEDAHMCDECLEEEYKRQTEFFDSYQENPSDMPNIHTIDWQKRGTKL
jgi:hypothetical protein